MTTRIKIVAVIPARAGSKGVANKNIRQLGDRPLIAHTIIDALSVQPIEEVYVSTDSEKIAHIAAYYGAKVPFLRPKKYAIDNSPDIEWATHFLNWFKEAKGYYPEYIVHLRATTPFRDIKVIEEAINRIKYYEEATSLISLDETVDDPLKCFKIGNDGYLIPLFKMKYHLMPRQTLPKLYNPNGYVDILKVETLLKGKLHGNKILPFLTSRIIEIDTEEDLKYAQYLLDKKEIK